MKKDITLRIDGRIVKIPEGTSILNAAEQAGIEIPRLCYNEDLEPQGTCGMCQVKIQGIPEFQRACITEARDGMEIETHTAELRKIRQGLLELILSSHPEDCLKCIKHGKCELQDLAEKLEIRNIRYDRIEPNMPVDLSAAGIVRDMNKCIGCGRCVSVCQEVQTVKAIEFMERGAGTFVAPGLEKQMGISRCVNCGQCVVTAPWELCMKKR